MVQPKRVAPDCRLGEHLVSTMACLDIQPYVGIDVPQIADSRELPAIGMRATTVIPPRRAEDRFASHLPVDGFFLAYL
jgi:hypothetical protein